MIYVFIYYFFGCCYYTYVLNFVLLIFLFLPTSPLPPPLAMFSVVNDVNIRDRRKKGKREISVCMVEEGKVSNEKEKKGKKRQERRETDLSSGKLCNI